MDSIVPPEIVTKILSNLGKSDLLNCRLVCNSWNKECLRHLRKSKFTQPLCKSSIKSYMEFIKRNQHPQFVLPFYINVRIDFFDNIRIQEMREFIKHLTLLTNMFGPECVVGLCLLWDVRSGEIDINWFAQLFNITSVGLEILDLNCQDYDPNILMKLVRILKQRSTHFLNLKKLKSLTHYDWNTFVQFIFENSPNLKKLNISYGYIPIISSIPIRFERLKTLNLFSIHVSDLRNIQKLHSTTVFPVLQKLKIGLKSFRGTENKNVFHGFLSWFSETIKSLTIKLYEEEGSKPIIRFPKFPQLHNLKLILTKSIPTVPMYFNSLDLNFNPDTFPMLKSIELPVGRVYLSHCALGTLSPDVSRLNSIFLNIQHLTLTVRYAHSLNVIPCHHQTCIRHDWNLKTSRSVLFDWCNTSGKPVKYLVYKNNVEGLQSIFPNVTDIVIVDKPKQKTKHRIQELIKKLIQSSRASIIQNFTLRNCEQDYLGQVLNPLSYQPRIFLENLKLSTECEQTIKDAFQNITDSSDDISIRRNVLNRTNPEKNISIVQENTSAANHNMKNVNTIKFEYSRVDEDGKIRSINNGNMTMTVNMLDLTLIVNEFPNLCQIGISSLLFDENQQKRSEQIHDIRTQFPTITINII